MSRKYYSEEFRREAIKQVVTHGYSVQEVAARLEISVQSLYQWLETSKQWAELPDELQITSLRRENTWLKKELTRLRLELEAARKDKS